MMIMAVVGYALVRLHALKQEDSRVLSVLLIRVLQPCLILRAFQIELTPDRMQGFIFATVASTISMLISIAFAKAMEKPLGFDPVDRASLTYANVGNLILPLISMSLGEEMVFYGSAFRAEELCSVKSVEHHLRSAVVAGYRLRMVSAVSYVFVFFPARWTHLKIDHRCVVAVVRYAVDDRISGSAHHAADERMTESSVVLVAHLVQAVRTYGKIGRYHGRLVLSVSAFTYRKAAEISGLHLVPRYVDDLRRQRLRLFYLIYEIVYPLRGISDDDLDESSDIGDLALHPKPLSDFRNERPEADALHYSPKSDTFCPKLCHFAYLSSC